MASSSPTPAEIVHRSRPGPATSTLAQRGCGGQELTAARHGGAILSRSGTVSCTCSFLAELAEVAGLQVRAGVRAGRATAVAARADPGRDSRACSAGHRQYPYRRLSGAQHRKRDCPDLGGGQSPGRTATAQSTSRTAGPAHVVHEPVRRDPRRAVPFLSGAESSACRPARYLGADEDDRSRPI